MKRLLQNFQKTLDSHFSAIVITTTRIQASIVLFQDAEEQIQSQETHATNYLSVGVPFPAYFSRSSSSPRLRTASFSSMDSQNIEDLSRRPFLEYFFHAIPLVIHPVIILRLLCHKVFGNMLRRKTQYSAHNLSPPCVSSDKESYPHMHSSSDGEQREDPPVSESSRQRISRQRSKRRSNLHVQIASPWSDSDDDEEIKRRRRVRRRAGSMDKHLLRMGSMRHHNGTMSLAIKAIADSLVTPLDLSLSPPPRATDLSDNLRSRRNIFRFPSVKKRISKSHGYLPELGQSVESEEGAGTDSPSYSSKVRYIYIFPHTI